MTAHKQPFRNKKCNEDVLICHFVLQLIKTLKQTKCIQNDLNTNSLLDNFIHILKEHDGDDEFETIHTAMSECHVITCDIFRCM